MARDIFISYSQPDRRCAFELTDHLEANGFSVWIAPRDVSPAAEWAAEIIDAIAAARVMVLVFSASSNDSPQVRREVERAVHKDLRILPFRIEDVLPSKSLEYFLSSHHWLDGFPSPRAPHYERLCASLRQWLTDTPAPGAAARRAAATAAPSPGAAMPATATPPTATVGTGATDSAGAADTAHAAGPTAAAAPSGANRFAAGELRDLEIRLARILGPIAGLLVNRAATDAADLPDLEHRLSAELDSPEDRQRFLQARS